MLDLLVLEWFGFFDHILLINGLRILEIEVFDGLIPNYSSNLLDVRVWNGLSWQVLGNDERRYASPFNPLYRLVVTGTLEGCLHLVIALGAAT